jgi:regulatory protein
VIVGLTTDVSPHSDALKLLARREFSSAQLRKRLLERGHPPLEVDATIDKLTESGTLDDSRVARAYARTAAAVKGRGRLRIARELQAMGISRETTAAALADVFAELDEAALIERAIGRKLRGARTISTKQEFARVYNFLTRQGFTPGGISDALRRVMRDPD